MEAHSLPGAIIAFRKASLFKTRFQHAKAAYAAIALDDSCNRRASIFLLEERYVIKIYDAFSVTGA